MNADDMKTIRMEPMRWAIAQAAILIFLVATVLTATDAEYTLDLTLDANAFSLSGTARISVTNLAPGQDELRFSAYLARNYRLEILSASINGSAVQPANGADVVSLALPSAMAGSPLDVVLEYRITQLPDVEGVVLLEDNYRDGRWHCWYPRLIAPEPTPSRYDVTLLLTGAGLIAHSASQGAVEEGTGSSLYTFSDSAWSLEAAFSPIFVEQRVQVAGTDLGLFVRQGSELWSNKLLYTLSEIFDFYAGQFDGFSRSRVDVILAGEEAPLGVFASRLGVVRDDTQRLAEEFGNVFVANYLRWRASVELARGYFGEIAAHVPGSIPWLREGLTLYAAQRYARSALLGGPVFDNIRQFYLNAAGGDADTSLDQTAMAAEQSGLDPMSVLAQSKGMWVVNMLAQELGKAFGRFIEMLHEYHRLLDNAAIKRLAEEAAGRSLDGFFNNWIFGDAEVDYGVVDVDRDGSTARIRLTNKGTAAPPVTVQVTFDDGSTESRDVAFAEREHQLSIETGGREIVRVRVDPDLVLPDVRRADNLRSLRGSERIQELYAIDNRLEIGDVRLTRQPVAVEGESQREGEFELTVTNLQERTVYLGLRMTTHFPGGRNRGVTRLLVQLSDLETVTIRNPLRFPGLGSGLVLLTAEYFQVGSPEAYERLDRNSKPDLTNYSVFEISR
jgi:hypothetical protein